MGKEMNDELIVPIVIDSDRIVGIQLELSPVKYVFLLEIYLPCSNHSIGEYKEC